MGLGMRRVASSSPWAGRVGYAGGFFLGVVLLVATVTKAMDPAAFAEQIAAEGIAGPFPVTAVVYLALALEAGLGLALVLGLRRLPVLVPAATLVAFFLFLTGRGAWRSLQGIGPETTCGCFGNLVERTPIEAFWQDTLLMVPALLLAFLARPVGEWAWRHLGVVSLGTVALVGLAWASPRLPLDDLATRLSPGSQVAEICAGRENRICLHDLAPDLDEGEWWVTLVDLSSAPATWVDSLNELTLGGTPLLVLTDASPDELHAFVWEWGPVFSLREAPASLLRPLYRSLPRSFLVRDGVVVLTSPGLPAVAGAPKIAEESTS
jgi:uncharacterized membrane protein YphA (DoxX/SURF4 family)